MQPNGHKEVPHGFGSNIMSKSKDVKALMRKYDREEIAMLAYQAAETRAIWNIMGTEAGQNAMSLQIINRCIEECIEEERMS